MKGFRSWPQVSAGKRERERGGGVEVMGVRARVCRLQRRREAQTAGAKSKGRYSRTFRKLEQPRTDDAVVRNARVQRPARSLASEEATKITTVGRNAVRKSVAAFALTLARPRGHRTEQVWRHVLLREEPVLAASRP